MKYMPYTEMDVILGILSLCLVMDSAASEEFGNCDVPRCRLTLRKRDSVSILSRFGEPLPTVLRGLLLEVPKSATKLGCYVNTTGLLDNYEFSNESAVAVVAFQCFGPIQLFLTEDTRYHPNIFTYLQITHCAIDLREVEKLSKSLHITSFYAKKAVVTNKPLDCFGDTLQNRCYLFQNTTVIVLEKPQSASTGYVDDLFNCSETFPEVKELSLSKMEWKIFPEYIIDKFPNVQSLELPGSELEVPPPFPWHHDLLEHSWNLSRNAFFDEQYTVEYDVGNISLRHHRRLLNLNHNKIRSFKDFQFRGLIHMLQLENNGLMDVGPQTFSEIIGLQHLDMKHNKLRTLPHDVFRNLTQLRHLNIANNQLTKLEDELFDFNVELKFFNAANNSISSLGRHLFDRLVNLRVIHLESNSLTSIYSKVFPLASVTLKVIHMSNNPLRVFPESVLYVRNIEKVFLRNTSISFDNFSDWLFRVSFSRMSEAVGKMTSSNLKLDGYMRRLIDLTGSKVENLYLDKYFEGNTKLDKYMRQNINLTLSLLLKNYKFVLSDNPLTCDCRIIAFNKFIEKKKQLGLFSGREDMFTDWKCSAPAEFIGKPMLTVEEKDTYCERDFAECPADCTCHVRSVTGIVIVDCRHTGLTELPMELPDGQLDLWFQNNNITTLAIRPYFVRVRHFILSNNAIDHINPNALLKLKDVEELFVDGNRLSKLPEEFKQVRAKTMSIKNNPYTCDCNTLWMKSWIFQHKDIVEDALEVVCNVDDVNEEGKLFISVPDDQFICKEDFDSVKHVVIPSVVCSVAIALLVVCVCLVYVFRLEAKVLLYIYFGIHPFDKDERECNEEIDVVIVHSPLVTGWVMQNVVEYLEAQGQRYVICEMMRDFVAGFSYQENIACMVKHSKRMLLVLSKDMVADDDLLKVAWNEAQEKIKELRTNYAIIVCYDVSIKEINNKDLRRYVKRGRYIDAKHGLFHEKIMYSMPQYLNDDYSGTSMPDMRHAILHMYSNDDMNKELFERHAFIAYSDQDMGYTMNVLRPRLEEKDYTLCLPDRDFIPGASKEENVLKAVDNCVHTLFLLSGDHLQDEWSLFTFRSASEKSLREKCNHLIVLFTNETDIENMDEEVRYYVKTHVTLNVNDENFFDRLLKALPPPDEYQPNIGGETNFVKFQNMMNGEINRAFVFEDEKYIKYELDEDKEEYIHDEECQCGKLDDTKCTDGMGNGFIYPLSDVDDQIEVSDKETLVNGTVQTHISDVDTALQSDVEAIEMTEVQDKLS